MIRIEKTKTGELERDPLQEALDTAWVALLSVPAYVERHTVAAEQRPQDEAYEFACTMCGWSKTLSVDDMAAYYESPFAPCGCGWECIECVV
jgi:hypothetical protein